MIDLPDKNKWKWETDWTLEKNENTDEFGWSYAIDFNKKYQKVRTILDYVRRRKWQRTCVLI